MGLITKVFTDSGISGVRVIVTSLKAVVLIPIITNLLGADSYGLWVSIFAFISLIAGTGGIHLHGSLIRFSAGDEELQTYSDILLFSTVLAVVLSVAIFSLGTLIDISSLLGSEAPDQAWLVLGSALLILTTISLQININFPRSEGMVKVYELLRIGRTIVETVTLVVIFGLGGTILAGILGLAGVGIAMNVALVATILVKYDVPKPDISNFVTYATYGVPMVPAALSNRLMSHADKYLILYMISPTAVGIYAVANTICSSLTDFTTILNPTLYPSVSEAWDQRNLDELRELYTLVFRYYSIMAIPALFGVVYLAYDIILVFSTSQIAAEGSILVPILASGYILRGYDNPLEYILTSTKDTRLVARATMISAGLNVGLNVVLILSYGIIGAAVGTMISHVVAFYLIYRYSTERFQFDLPLSSIVRAVLAGLVMVAMLHSIPFSLSPLSTVVIYPPVGAAVYFATLFVIGEFSHDEIERLVSEIREFV